MKGLLWLTWLAFVLALIAPLAFLAHDVAAQETPQPQIVTIPVSGDDLTGLRDACRACRAQASGNQQGAGELPKG